MNYRVLIVRSAQRELHNLPPPIRDRVARRLLELENSPRPQGSRKLRNTNRYRLRVGYYRVIYRVDDEDQEVLVLSIAHRREVYRQGLS